MTPKDALRILLEGATTPDEIRAFDVLLRIVETRSKSVDEIRELRATLRNGLEAVQEMIERKTPAATQKQVRAAFGAMQARCAVLQEVTEAINEN